MLECLLYGSRIWFAEYIDMRVAKISLCRLSRLGCAMASGGEPLRITLILTSFSSLRRILFSFCLVRARRALISNECIKAKPTKPVHYWNVVIANRQNGGQLPPFSAGMVCLLSLDVRSRFDYSCIRLFIQNIQMIIACIAKSWLCIQAVHPGGAVTITLT